MSTVGQREKRTQQRVVTLFREQLGYDYLGDWTDRAGNRNIEEQFLRAFLRDRQGYDEALISRALYLLDKTNALKQGMMHELLTGRTRLV
ncbi:MAG: hypothetical protein HY348_07025 [Nitrospira defluvii]|nr:hypothetical protein [Nitrospira defluvii]